MLAFINLFFDICRFQRNPQDIPSSLTIKNLTLALYITLGFFVTAIHETLAISLVTVFVDTALMLSLAYISLWISGLNDRILQTITALAGTGSIIMVLSTPFVIWLLYVPPGEASISNLFLTALVFWNIAVIGHILRHALNMPIWAGFTIAIIYTMIYYRVIGALIVSGNS